METTGAIFQSTDELLEMSCTTIAELEVCVELLIVRLQLRHPAAVWNGAVVGAGVGAGVGAVVRAGVGAIVRAGVGAAVGAGGGASGGASY